MERYIVNLITDLRNHESMNCSCVGESVRKSRKAVVFRVLSIKWKNYICTLVYIYFIVLLFIVKYRVEMGITCVAILRNAAMLLQII